MAVSSTTVAGDSHFGVGGPFDSSSRWRRPAALLADLAKESPDLELSDLEWPDTESPDPESPDPIEAAEEARSRLASAAELDGEALVTSDASPKKASRAAAREQLLAELAADTAPRGFRIARDLLGDRDEAEDAVQEALARACEQCHRIRDPRAIRAWFYRVLTNLCMRALRRRRLRRLFFGAQKPADDERPAAASAPAPDRQLAHSRAVARLLRYLDDLPAKQRAALLLRYGHELPVADIADMLGVRPATVKTHLVRGLRRLRKLMEQEQ